jgi:hypothetical protein
MLFDPRSGILPQRLRFVLWFLLAFRSRRLRRPTRMTTPASTSAAHAFRATSHPRFNPLFRCLAHLFTRRGVGKRAVAVTIPPLLTGMYQFT